MDWQLCRLRPYCYRKCQRQSEPDSKRKACFRELRIRHQRPESLRLRRSRCGQRPACRRDCRRRKLHPVCLRTRQLQRGIYMVPLGQQRRPVGRNRTYCGQFDCRNPRIRGQLLLLRTRRDRNSHVQTNFQSGMRRPRKHETDMERGFRPSDGRYEGPERTRTGTRLPSRRQG